MSTLAQLAARTAQLLLDTGAAVFPTALLSETINHALDDYSEANPLVRETIISAPAAGREIALSALTGITDVIDIWWPYHSTSAEEWPPPRVPGFELWWDDGQPVLVLTQADGDQPQTDDEIRVWYTHGHTIQNLNGEAATTLPPHHESLIVRGAAGYALNARAIDLAEDNTLGTSATPNYSTMADLWLTEFRQRLTEIRTRSAARRQPYPTGYRADKWDK